MRISAQMPILLSSAENNASTGPAECDKRPAARRRREGRRLDQKGNQQQSDQRQHDGGILSGSGIAEGDQIEMPVAA